MTSTEIQNIITEIQNIIKESESEKTPVSWWVNTRMSSDFFNPEELTIDSNNSDSNTEGQRLSWFNWVGLNFDEEENEISFRISTKDPRGADIAFRVYKEDDEIKIFSSSDRKKDEEIRKLKELLSEKDDEIRMLKE